MESLNCLFLNEQGHTDSTPRSQIREFIGNLSSEILLVAHIKCSIAQLPTDPYKNAHKIQKDITEFFIHIYS